MFKIGMTRRPIRQERIDELSNASVPFAFDIHALIKSENAPSLETKLHHLFRDNQVNKNNFRKEFFRVTLAEIRQAVEKMKQQGETFEMECDWIEKAGAEDFYRSRTIENNPQEMEAWRKQQEKRAGRLEREALRPSVVNDDADSQET
jgi:DNA-binding transcriptional MerR regulator